MTPDELSRWWGTAISRIEPGVIELRGRPIQDLIGSASFVSVIWLLLRGSLPSPDQAALLEAALVASVDHGPQAPSIAAARMAATCGVGLNTAVIYAELGFLPPLARGLFVLSRSVGILAHAWEESQQGSRIKGPMPPSILPAYLSPNDSIG